MCQKHTMNFLPQSSGCANLTLRVGKPKTQGKKYAVIKSLKMIKSVQENLLHRKNILGAGVKILQRLVWVAENVDR